MTELEAELDTLELLLQGQIAYRERSPQIAETHLSDFSQHFAPPLIELVRGLLSIPCGRCRMDAPEHCPDCGGSGRFMPDDVGEYPAVKKFLEETE